MLSITLLDATGATSAQPKGGGWEQFILIAAIMVAFWFFMIRPQSKKAKKQKEFVNSLDKGSKVVTLAGIHGKINKMNEDGTIDLEVSAGTFLKMEKSSISLDLTEAANKATATASAVTQKK